MSESTTESETTTENDDTTTEGRTAADGEGTLLGTAQSGQTPGAMSGGGAARDDADADAETALGDGTVAAAEGARDPEATDVDASTLPAGSADADRADEAGHGDDARSADDEQAASTTPDDESTDQAAAGAADRPSGRRAALEREGEIAADFIETLLDICDLDGDLDVDIDGDRAAVSLVDSDEGRVPRRLVGNGGEVLEALQELARLAVKAETGERSRLMLDVAGHRAQRRASLVTVAQKAIAEVKASGETASLDPMTAFERKVVHDEVLAAGLVSESDGTEPRRFVVIKPA